MPRDFPLSNRRLLVNFDLGHRLRDIYYPHIGAHNHAAGCASLVRVWVDGDFSWLDSAEWEQEMTYASGVLVTQCKFSSNIYKIER